ncbi:SgcJ/EcaC family oxidoreductase [Actinomycetospora sp. TBRC 11914]|uniref:SgcJ/EcaC family oxidoreductase n=1 Tax=Actinomycetospora sp. TBRC 11914 TaxID=2729387 RepID=UPI00145FBA0B|nr:SgcJ/EcaC family oxidoreductase [Actinomycetospora sp. TBRC 11914]NMO89749.1 SgcJ/EcaC family oxidoreductase [Actinomycetospora sp. TBRC 11914]
MTTDAPIGDLLIALAAAWDAGDADAYGALFTEDATYVTFFGHVSHGRTEIVDGHRWLFERTPGSVMTPFAETDCGIRFLAPDVALVVARGPGTTAPDQDAADRASTVSLVVVRTDAGWRFAHFQNTRVRSPGG